MAPPNKRLRLARDVRVRPRRRRLRVRVRPVDARAPEAVVLRHLREHAVARRVEHLPERRVRRELLAHDRDGHVDDVARRQRPVLAFARTHDRRPFVRPADKSESESRSDMSNGFLFRIVHI